MSSPLVVARTLPLPDGALVRLMHERGATETIRIGPNEVHAFITHHPGCGHGAKHLEIEDLGISHNLMTTAARDLFSAALGATGFGVSATVATATSATSLTATGTPFVVDAYKGWIVVAEETTNAPVFGNIGSNSTSVLTIDAWKNADGTAGATPGATANYAIYPTARGLFMGLTENAGAPAAGDTVLTGEITTGGCGRASVTYAHTGGTATLTLQKAFSVTASFPAIHKLGILTASNTTAAGILVFESALNADANVVNGDTLTVTDTVTTS